MSNQLALVKMTRAELYQRVRSEAANAFANVRSNQVSERADFERHYGSTSELDQSFVNDMRAMMLRASAIAMNAGTTKTAYDKTIVPNKTLEKVASILAGAVGECELYLATRKARSMFAPPAESDFLQADRYRSTVDDPYSWVGPQARHIVDEILARVQIVDVGKPTSIQELQAQVAATCEHELVDGHPDVEEYGDASAHDDDTGGTWRRCSRGCGYGGIELELHGDKIIVSEDVSHEYIEICKDGVLRLPEGVTLSAYQKLPKKKREALATKIQEPIEADYDNERASKA